MGIIKGVGKVIGTAVLGATGVASTVLRACASGTGMNEVADAIGKIQDKSFDTIQNMWTPDERKTEDYYEAQAQKSIDRAESATRTGEAKRREIERMKEKAGEN